MILLLDAHALLWWLADELPRHHRDPFDRMLVTQGIRLGAILVSCDPAFAPYGVDVLAA